MRKIFLTLLLALVCQASWALDRTATGFFYPTGTSQIKVRGSGFFGSTNEDGYRPIGKWHCGFDISGKYDDLVYAIADGKVVKVSEGGWSDEDKDPPDNFGYLILHTLANGEKFIAVYGHLHRPATLKEGATIKAGQPLGKLGYWADGIHLHFGIYQDRNDLKSGSYPNTGYGRLPNPKPDMETFDYINCYGNWFDPIKFIQTKQLSGGANSPDSNTDYSPPLPSPQPKADPKTGGLGNLLSKLRLPKVKLPDILDPGLGKAKANQSAPNQNSDSPISPRDFSTLLSKNRVEIESVLGTTCQQLNTASYTYYTAQLERNWNTYIYGYCPSKYYMTRIEFSPGGEMGHGLKNDVYRVSTDYEYSIYDSEMQFYLRPEQLVPDSVLSHKYDAIYQSLAKNSIDVVWHFDGKTYVLTVCDKESRPLYSTKAENGGETAIANGNTTNFKLGYVLHFSCCNAVERFYPYHIEPLLKNASDSEEKDLVTKGTGYRNLIGLDFKGVVARMGKQPDNTGKGASSVTSYCTLIWGYKSNPLSVYSTSIHFEHYNNLGAGETFKITHYVDVVCNNLKLAVPPQRIVPAHILSSEPKQIVWCMEGNVDCIAVIWVKDGHTYCLGLSDTTHKVVERRQVLNDQGVYETRMYLTAAGKSFRNCNRSLFFVCIDRDTDFFAPTSIVDAYTPSEYRNGFVSYSPLGTQLYKFKN